MPSKVLVLDCSREIAKSRFLARHRDNDDDRAMFARRYAEYVENKLLIEQRYPGLIENVSVCLLHC